MQGKELFGKLNPLSIIGQIFYMKNIFGPLYQWFAKRLTPEKLRKQAQNLLKVWENQLKEVKLADKMLQLEQLTLKRDLSIISPEESILLNDKNNWQDLPGLEEYFTARNKGMPKGGKDLRLKDIPNERGQLKVVGKIAQGEIDHLSPMAKDLGACSEFISGVKKGKTNTIELSKSQALEYAKFLDKEYDKIGIDQDKSVFQITESLIAGESIDLDKNYKKIRSAEQGERDGAEMAGSELGDESTALTAGIPLEQRPTSFVTKETPSSVNQHININKEYEDGTIEATIEAQNIGDGSLGNTSTVQDMTGEGKRNANTLDYKRENGKLIIFDNTGTNDGPTEVDLNMADKDIDKLLADMKAAKEAGKMTGKEEMDIFDELVAIQKEKNELDVLTGPWKNGNGRISLREAGPRITSITNRERLLSETLKDKVGGDLIAKITNSVVKTVTTKTQGFGLE